MLCGGSGELVRLLSFLVQCMRTNAGFELIEGPKFTAGEGFGHDAGRLCWVPVGTQLTRLEVLPSLPTGTLKTAFVELLPLHSSTPKELHIKPAYLGLFTCRSSSYVLPGVSFMQWALSHAEWLLLSRSRVIALVLVPFLVGFVSSGAISVIKLKFSYELIGVLCLVVFSVFAAFLQCYMVFSS